jgi:UDP:flavonoid glycosyltransferase YjiC (YdhE family)
MWKPGVAPDLRQLGSPFDFIIEPGDYASDYDDGVTSRDRARVHRVAPIVYSPSASRPDRQRACAELGLRAGDTNVLVQLGAGQINDIGSTVGAVTSILSRYPSVRAAVARSELSADASSVGTSVIEIQRFPITHWIAAFDAAVVAAGYNSFHEMMSMAVPTIIVPNLDTKTDDQDARSRWAHDHGLGIRWDGRTIDDLEVAIAAIANSSERKKMSARLAELAPATGATEAAALIREWIR